MENIGLVGTAIVANTLGTSWAAYLDYRQARAMSTPMASLPLAAQRLTTPEAFAKSQAYTRDRFVFSAVRKLTEGLILDNLRLWGLTLGRSWNAVGNLGWFAKGSFAHSWAWGAAVDIVDALLHVPWDAYSTFVVEQRHGFNKTNVVTFVTDRLKSIALSTFVMRPILTAVLRWVVTRFGASFPLYLCGASAVLMAAATFLIPTLVMPLFNKFTPLEDGDVKRRVEALAKRVEFPLTKLFTMDGSRRSAHSNAFFYGFGGNKRIVLFDTLLEQMSPGEIEAVVGHEIGHWHHNHMMKNFALSLVNVFAFGQGSSTIMFNPKAYEAFGMPRGYTDPVVGFDIFAAVYWTPVFAVTKIAMSLLSRRFEFQADAFAAKLGYSAELREGLVKMFKENKGSLTPDPLFAACTYSHPPLVERLNHLETMPEATKVKTD